MKRRKKNEIVFLPSLHLADIHLPEAVYSFQITDRLDQLIQMERADDVEFYYGSTKPLCANSFAILALAVSKTNMYNRWIELERKYAFNLLWKHRSDLKKILSRYLIGFSKANKKYGVSLPFGDQSCTLSDISAVLQHVTEQTFAPKLVSQLVSKLILIKPFSQEVKECVRRRLEE